MMTTPSLHLELKPKEETKKESLDEILKHQAKGAEMVKKARQDPQWVDSYNKRFGPHFKTTVLPKEDPNKKTNQQLRTLRSWGLPTPVGLGDKYKSDLRTPVQKKRDAYVEKNHQLMVFHNSFLNKNRINCLNLIFLLFSMSLYSFLLH